MTVFSKILRWSAKSVNYSCCIWICYQPKIPIELLKSLDE
ncbi:cyclic lactone autoinducer peptide [uncultured Vagococcus sp.]